MMEKSRGIYCLFLSIFLFVTTPINAGGALTQIWPVNALARAPIENIELKSQQGRTLKVISRQQMIYLYAAMKSIVKVSELNAEFIITSGDLPNAFATVDREHGNIIAINFAMLDLIQNDLDMAAALIGHELAHLKLHHLKDHLEAVQRNRNQSFSAKNTKYSRDNEREADYLGVIWALEAGYDPNGAVRLQEALYKVNKKLAQTTSVSHPSSIERLTVLKSLVRRFSN